MRTGLSSRARLTLLLLGSMAATAGCTTVPGPAPSVAETPAAEVAAPEIAAPLDAVGAVRPGELAELPAGNAIGARRVLVGEEYRAASGRLCRHVLPANTDLTRVVCRRADGHWSATRSLTGARGVVPVAALGTAADTDAGSPTVVPAPLP